MLSLLRKGMPVSLALLTGLSFLCHVGSHSDQCCCGGYCQWHFLLVPWTHFLPSLSVSLPFSSSLFFQFSSSSPPSFFKMSSLPLISPSVWVCLYLDSPTSSLQYLSQHLPLWFSLPRYFLCFHASSSFCSLPVSKPLALISLVSLPFPSSALCISNSSSSCVLLQFISQ